MDAVVDAVDMRPSHFANWAHCDRVSSSYPTPVQTGTGTGSVAGPGAAVRGEGNNGGAGGEGRAGGRDGGRDGARGPQGTEARLATLTREQDVIGVECDSKRTLENDLEGVYSIFVWFSTECHKMQ